MMKRTGVGIGGGGGAKAGQVTKILFPNSGHLLPMENLTECAEAVSAELGKRLNQFKMDEAFLDNHQSGKSERDGLVVSKRWQEGVRKPSHAKRSMRKKL